MSQEESTPPFKSSLPELKLPVEGFKSSLPPHLLEGADEQTRYIMNEISRNSAATEFACRAAVTHNEHLRTLNGRTSKNEKAVTDIKETIQGLSDKANSMEPIIKPVSQFMGLWEHRWFRIICYIAGFFLLTYALPWYLAHPVSIETLLAKWVG